MRRELVAVAILLAGTIAFPATLFAYQVWRTTPDRTRVIELVARTPDQGGWTPGTIRVSAGDHVRLRISSPDVVHGFEIPALNVRADEILPGHVQEVEFVATEPGRYPFACTRWCSVDHWRMRGVIEVSGTALPSVPLGSVAPPVYQQLQLDLDALHPAKSVPPQRPSAARGAQGNLNLTTDFRTQSPSQIFMRLREDPTYRAVDDLQLWDAVAFAYARSTSSAGLERGGQLYARDCAACHGELGTGNGPAGKNLPGLSAMRAGMRQGPSDFTDAFQMLGASDALLQGKVLRGGMGTGMPEWGSLYNDQDLWDVVTYLRTFTFDLKQNP